MALAVFIPGVACAACSPASTTGAPGPDASGVSPDSGLPVNGCGENEFGANDHTAANDPRIVQGPPGVAPQQYVPNCIRIKAGQTVTFTGDNGHHPVDTFEVSGGMPFPILTGSQASDAGTTFTVTVSDPGVVRFNCDVHPSIMSGAIEIVP
jgi:plastocyanin